MKARCKHRGRPSAHSSRLARREMNHLNQKVAAQNGASSSGVPHGRGTPVEEDNSKGHCRPGGSRGGIPGDSCLSRKNPETQTVILPLPCLPIRAAAGVDRRSGRTKEEGTEAQSGAGHQVKGSSLQGRPALRETQTHGREE